MSAEYELQRTVVAALKASAGVAVFLGDRIYDRVPATPALPYLSIRGLQSNDADTECIESWEVFLDLDVWSSGPGKPQATRAASAVRDALHEQHLVMADPYGLVDMQWRSTDVVDDEGGLLVRARMTFVAQVDRAED